MGKHSKKLHSKEIGSSQKLSLQMKNTINPLVQNLLEKCTSVNPLKKLEWENFTKIWSLVQDIQNIEKDYGYPLPKREENWDNFYSWCVDNDAKFDSIRIKEISKGNYGIITGKNLNEGDSLFSVPRKMMMTSDTAKKSILGPLITKDRILQNMPNVVLALHLLLELINENSFWKPYISILPSVYTTVLYFDIDEIQLLKGSPVQEEALTICSSVARQYAYFHQLFQYDAYAKLLGISKYFTYDLYRWAVSTVMTRQNLVPTPLGDMCLSALVPLWDMCNHANGKLFTDFNLEKDYLESLSMSIYHTGGEVYIFYGKRTNAEFFLHNGFVFLHNEHDAMNVKFGLSKSDPLFSLKSKLCTRLGLPLNGTFQLDRDGVFQDNLLSFLKVNVMKEDELNQELHESSNLETSTDLSNRAIQFLKVRLSLLLNSYRTTLEEDEVLLKTSLSVHHHLATQLCLFEKTMLKRSLDYCCSRIKL